MRDFFITSIFLRWFFAAGIEFLRWKDLHWSVLDRTFERGFDEQVLLYSLVRYFAHVGGLFQFQSWSVLHQRRRQGLLCVSESWCFRGKLGLIRLQFLVRYQFRCSLLRWSRFSFLAYFLIQNRTVCGWWLVKVEILMKKAGLDFLLWDRRWVVVKRGLSYKSDI